MYPQFCLATCVSYAKFRESDCFTEICTVPEALYTKDLKTNKYSLKQKTLFMQYVASQMSSGGQSTQIKYLSKSTDTYNKILLQ